MKLDVKKKIYSIKGVKKAYYVGYADKIKISRRKVSGSKLSLGKAKELFSGKVAGHHRLTFHKDRIKTYEIRNKYNEKIYSKKGLKKPLTSKKEPIFHWSNLKETDITLIKAISLLDMNKDIESGPEIITSNLNMINIAEQYANGGFENLIENIEETIDSERHLITLIAKEFEK